jgi:hypothetical protein
MPLKIKKTLCLSKSKKTLCLSKSKKLCASVSLCLCVYIIEESCENPQKLCG